MLVCLDPARTPLIQLQTTCRNFVWPPQVPSGIKIILNTSPDRSDCRDVLQYIYDGLYVEYVLKNPLYTPGQPFSNELFTQGLSKYLKATQGMT